MKAFLAVLFVVLCGTQATNLSAREAEDKFEQLLWCVGQALDGGLPEAQIPDHNPLIIQRNMTLDLDFLGLKGYVRLDKRTLEHITDFDIRSIEGIVAEDGSHVGFNYDVHWDDMAMNGLFTTEYTDVLGANHKYTGSFNMVMYDLTFTGVFDLHIQEYPNLHNFTVLLGSSSTSVHVTGLGVISDILFNEAASVALNVWLNSDPDIIKDSVVPSLMSGINERWLNEEKFYRVEAIIDNCNLQKHSRKPRAPRPASRPIHKPQVYGSQIDQLIKNLFP